MNKIIFVPLTLFCLVIAQLFLPWWTLAVVCFTVCYFFKPDLLTAFFGSLLSVFVVWYGMAWWSDQYFDEDISDMLGGIFGGISGSTVLFITGITGGIVGGLSGLVGSWSRLVLDTNK